MAQNRDARYEDDLNILDDDGELVKASELREFVYCQRSWCLARRGFRVSDKAEKAREVGVAFHEERAAAAERGSNPQALKWAAVLALLAIALLLAKVLVH